MKKQYIIPIFVPHLGCPNDCSFCNQRHITGQINNASISDVHSAVAIAKTSKNYNPKNTEIAFCCPAAFYSSGAFPLTYQENHQMYHLLKLKN